MESTKRVIGASLILSLSVIVALHLALFWVNDGELIVGEQSRVVLIAESIMAAGIFVFGIERMVAAIRTQRARGSPPAPPVRMPHQLADIDVMVEESPRRFELPDMEVDNVSATAGSEVAGRIVFGDLTEGHAAASREAAARARERATATIAGATERAKAETREILQGNSANHRVTGQTDS